MKEIVLNDNQAGRRFDKVLKSILREAPDSFLYRMLRKKNITLNGKKAAGNEQTVKGDVVRFFMSDETFTRFLGERQIAAQKETVFPEIPILYEDNDVLVFVKPEGLLSQKREGGSVSANDWVIRHALSQGILSAEDPDAFRPSVVNRLDRNTSGIMAAGMSMKGLQALSEMFRKRTVEKYYYALVLGKTKACESLSGYLKKDERTNRVRVYSKEVPGSSRIETAYKTLSYDEIRDLSLLKVHLLTGKSHQIRAHLSAAGHPILGDPKYGDPAQNLRYRVNSQCLFSCCLKFPPSDLAVSGMEFSLPVPSYWPISEVSS